MKPSLIAKLRQVGAERGLGSNNGKMVTSHVGISSVGVYVICVLCIVYNCVLRREILRFIQKK